MRNLLWILQFPCIFYLMSTTKDLDVVYTVYFGMVVVVYALLNYYEGLTKR